MQSQILTDLVHILETGSEADVELFVKDHWKDLPQKLQDHLAVAMMIDAVKEEARDKQDFETIRENFFEALEELERQDLEENSQKLQ